jgi:hypothetical protein
VSDALAIVTSPLPVTAGLGVGELGVAVVADALARRAASATGVDALVHLPVLVGDRSGLLALERAGRPVDDLAAFEAGRAAAADEQLAALGVRARVGVGGDDDAVGRRVREAATVAFVRLFDQGLVELVDMVVAVCPSCATVVDGADAEPGTAEADVLDLVVRLDGDGDGDGGDDGDGGVAELLVPVVAVELLEGATAGAVPLGPPAAGAPATLPLTGRRVPVVAETGRVEPAMVVPAHDRDDHALASVHRLGAPQVLGEDGVVVADGPLAGLGRYAARQAARALVDAEGVAVAITAGQEQVERCRHCGSTTVAVLGRHWVLRGGRLEVTAADAVRDGRVAFVPADAREAFLATALADRPWCLDRTVAGGVPLPAATCIDCGRLSVEVAPSTTCGKCLGELRAGDATLDARFVAAFWPLAVAGWPRPARRQPLPSVAVVTPEAATSWLPPALALSCHLMGELPIGTVVVHPPQGWPDGVDAEAFAALVADDRRAARLVLLAGDGELDARPVLDALDHPSGDDADVVDAVEVAAASLDDGGAGPLQATALLLAALGGGVPLGPPAERARRLAEPFLGDGDGDG